MIKIVETDKMKKHILFLTSALLSSLFIVAQIPTNFTATDCSNTSKTIHTVLGTTGKSIIIMSKGVDCSACRSTASGWQTWASQNTTDVEVWGAITYRYNPMVFSNPCAAVNSWVNQYAWTNIFAFPDNNRDFLGPAMPRYYVYSAIDSSIVYNGSSSSTARSIALQNSVVGINELNALKAVSVSISNGQLTLSQLPNEPLQFEVYNVNGQLIQSASVNTETQSIGTSHIKSGIYLLRLGLEGKFQTRKLFIP